MAKFDLVRPGFDNKAQEDAHMAAYALHSRALARWAAAVAAYNAGDMDDRAAVEEAAAAKRAAAAALRPHETAYLARLKAAWAAKNAKVTARRAARLTAAIGL